MANRDVLELKLCLWLADRIDPENVIVDIEEGVVIRLLDIHSQVRHPRLLQTGAIPPRFSIRLTRVTARTAMMHESARFTLRFPIQCWLSACLRTSAV
jgi:hypothetical protein